ncbi:hypothetical protein B0T24DRAFT_722394 [Lasiosphaeria ovina]|uniref:Gamma-glutamylcyclotransferase AIG2-like domain-containing protein n=1 Tax=Lasiosphaeria ovina TaxID=92902 RepID=A0AAE0K3W6_9PEZI|nr:hypothetical protein B0T24DRAFT_722394 [Lasiosphaeria ovina]
MDPDQQPWTWVPRSQRSAQAPADDELAMSIHQQASNGSTSRCNDSNRGPDSSTSNPSSDPNSDYDYESDYESDTSSIHFHDPVTADDIARWVKLFNYTPEEASKKLHELRRDPLTHGANFPDADWADFQLDHPAHHGWDSEAYEHVRARADTAALLRRVLPRRAPPAPVYIVKLGGPLDTAEAVQAAAGLATPPAIRTTPGDSGVQVRFCRVAGEAARRNILAWADAHKTSNWRRPVMLRDWAARKALSATNLDSELGIGSELPKNRPRSLEARDARLRPAQHEYPVWYFVYGDDALAEQPATLQRVLGEEEGEKVASRAARTFGGELVAWGAGAYRGLVDAEMDGWESVVQGRAVLVKDREAEEVLRYHQTSQYEVVRCDIEMVDGDNETVRGLTFRFVGVADRDDFYGFRV